MIDTVTAAQLETMDLPPPKQLIDGVLTVGFNILAGNPKAGKSFLSLGMALAIANGGRAFNKIPVGRHAVLYLALEDTRYRLKARLKAMSQGHPNNLHFATYLQKLGDGGFEELHAYLEEHRDIGMVVIDTLARVADAKTGADVYGEDAAVGTSLHEMAHLHEVALLVVHHTRKQAHGDFLHMVSGSAGFTGAADTVLVLTRKRNESVAILEITGRDIKEQKMDLTWYSSKGGWIARDAVREGIPGKPAASFDPHRTRWES